MIFVSQQPDSIVVFLHTWSSKLTDNVSSYKIYVVKQIIECWQIFNRWNIVHVDSFELIGTEDIHFISGGVEKFGCFFFQSLIFVHVERNSTKKTQFVVYGCLVFSSNVRQLIV